MGAVWPDGCLGPHRSLAHTSSAQILHHAALGKSDLFPQAFGDYAPKLHPDAATAVSRGPRHQPDAPTSIVVRSARSRRDASHEVGEGLDLVADNAHGPSAIAGCHGQKGLAKTELLGFLQPLGRMGDGTH